MDTASITADPKPTRNEEKGHTGAYLGPSDGINLKLCWGSDGPVMSEKE